MKKEPVVGTAIFISGSVALYFILSIILRRDPSPSPTAISSPSVDPKLETPKATVSAAPAKPCTWSTDEPFEVKISGKKVYRGEPADWVLPDIGSPYKTTPPL